MCRKDKIHQSSHQWVDDSVSSVNSIGELFRTYGEQYIDAFKPNRQQIKFIRSVRLCRTPALGGICYTCKSCGKKNLIYKSCGNGQCPVCQNIKREQWIDKLRNKLLHVPYVHAVFTLPHQLNGLAKSNPTFIYTHLLKASWQTIKEVSKARGATPGMTSVLHTFGSDLKYHIHVHALVTFGGLDTEGKWVYPQDRYKIVSYRTMCGTFKRIFLSILERGYQKLEIRYHETFETMSRELKDVRWVVHTTRPTMDSEQIQNYLGRYINRIAITNSRLKLLKDKEEVALIYNDYKQQQPGQPAPKVIKCLPPMVAIDHILQHVLPRYFPKTRNYGLHNGSNKRKTMACEAVKAHPQTVRTVIQIITHLLKRPVMECEICMRSEFEMDQMLPDYQYIRRFVPHWTRSPPQRLPHSTRYLRVNQGEFQPPSGPVLW